LAWGQANLVARTILYLELVKTVTRLPIAMALRTVHGQIGRLRQKVGENSGMADAEPAGKRHPEGAESNAKGEIC
jgi:hypothetical protein